MNQKNQNIPDRATNIHKQILTVDTHCDTPMTLVGSDYDMGKRHNPSGFGKKMDLPRMKEGGLDAEFFAIFTGQEDLSPEGYSRARKKANNMINAIFKMCIDYPELVELALSPEDGYRLEKEGKIAAYIGMENGYPLGRDLSLVQFYFNKGVRYITLCHGGDNDICDSSTERKNPADNGLSEFGKKVVLECNRLGMMIDVSHASDKSFYDILSASKVPVIASHSSSRELCDHPRNLSDDMLLALKKKEGVVQICLVSSFLKKPEPNPERDKAFAALRKKYQSVQSGDKEMQDERRKEYWAILRKYPSKQATVNDLVDHIDHIVKIIGIDYVGIGTDFDGGGGIFGCNEVSELPNITKELLHRGYTQNDIRKIWGGNFMRVFKEVKKKAAL